MKRDTNADLEKLADAFFDNLERETRCEYGGWGLDDKRPFGNSDVNNDIFEIIGMKPTADDYFSKEQEDYATDLYDKLGEYLREQWERRKPTLQSSLATQPLARPPNKSVSSASTKPEGGGE